MANFETLPAKHFSVHNAFLLAQVAQLAYFNEHEISDILTNEWGFTKFDFFDNAGTQCFLAGNQKMEILVFRGTELHEFNDLLANANFVLQPDLNGRIHKGFRTALDYVWPEVRDRIQEHENDGRKLWITGHSLGAALATLATARLEWVETIRVDGLYIFGSPRVGDKIFANAYNKDLKERTFRFINNNDMITRVPPRIWGYQNVGSLCYLDVNGQLHQEIDWFTKFMDRIEGRLEKLEIPGIDGIKDHGIDRYVEILRNLAEPRNTIDFYESQEVA